MSKQSFTRSELYDLVWSKPMRTLGQELGISDVGLKKVCRRHGIPTPPQGYWNKKAAGHKVHQLLLPPSTEPRPDRIHIEGATSRLPAKAREIIAASKIQKQQPLVAPEIVTGKDLRDLHRAVRATARTLRKSKADSSGAIRAQGEGECGVTVATGSAERVIGFLDALFRLLDQEGLTPKPVGKHVRVDQGEDNVLFSITERSKRVPHVPTPAELLAEERRLKKREQYWRYESSLGSSIDLYSKAYPEFDARWSGQLVFQLDGWEYGVRKSWGDGKTQTLETVLPDIIAGLKVMLATRAAERERRAGEARRQAEWARRRDLASKRQAREKRRFEYIDRFLSRHDEVARLRKLAALLPRTGSSDDIERLSAWVYAHLAEVEAKLTDASIQSEIQAQELFPESDPLLDPLGDPAEPTGRWH